MLEVLGQAILPESVNEAMVTNIMLGVGLAVYVLNTVLPKITAALNRRNGKQANGDAIPGMGLICQQHSTTLATLTEALSNMRADVVEMKATVRVDMAEIKALLREQRAREFKNNG